MKTAILAAIAGTAFAGTAYAQTAPAKPTSEEVLAQADRLRGKITAMRAEITRISRDPSIPEERRSAQIDSLASQVEADAQALSQQAELLSTPDTGDHPGAR